MLALFTMLTGTKADPVAQVIWCEGSHTLHFTYQESVSVGSSFDGSSVTAVWSGDAVTASPTTTRPVWLPSVWNDLTTVKITNTFVNVKPTSLREWFWGCSKLKRIEGIEYLNTSEVTTMRDMFHGCGGLTTIDMTHFDIAS